ncbi:hypothetical protein PF005_g23698 [Phytophthora fragariae]|uniref:Uncharacterized protein n=1 Tax=Phytophthora fragariae TaxID=53985 RepID=A0A6A3W5B7_9STRA|nr:hypothetical protein PF003_g15790 [Phytophthora fragariae]KAE8925351.1 hypothetical protein PF009_g24442 [Phytophthora fragariae]KAE8980490.1 hypothetical protein PF011_g22421 [Phytophthora fragariae]KAE9078774.1 hypothetical protein PF010_g23018 [Phytophthora fragariae]KAE9078862.1 hypothetical protein PF007_g23681 [Phytophthora fragariae]
MVIASLRAITMGLTAKSSALAPRLVTSTPSKCSTIATLCDHTPNRELYPQT